MKKNLRLASVFLILILMNSCGNKVGRYQMVVSPPVEGETKYYDPAVIVCDTKTGKVWSHFVSGKSPHPRTRSRVSPRALARVFSRASGPVRASGPSIKLLASSASGGPEALCMHALGKKPSARFRE